MKTSQLMTWAVFMLLSTSVYGQMNPKKQIVKDTVAVSKVSQLADTIFKEVTKKYPIKEKNISYEKGDARAVFEANKMILTAKEAIIFRNELVGKDSLLNLPNGAVRKKTISDALEMAVFKNDVDILIDSLRLIDTAIESNEIEFRVERIAEYKVIYEVYERFKGYIDQQLKGRISGDIYLNGLLKNLDIVKKHMNLLLENQFIFYRYTPTSKQFVKSIHLFHDNDFLLFSKMNEDRNYTGGFRFEFTTDYFKMRLFRPLNKNNILSYQSILLGGEGYTPYIRFKEDEVENAMGIRLVVNQNTGYFDQASQDSIIKYMRARQTQTDRPFASFQYIARGKYRLNYHGHWRSKSFFKIGTIGGNIGRNLQAAIHQDLTQGSIKVLNWEDQIANGGRLAFNIDHHFDLMLFSSESTVFEKDKYLRESNRSKWPTFLNVYAPLEVHTGTELDALGAGLGLSNRNFKEKSGTNDLKIDDNRSQPMLQRWYNNFSASSEIRYRYVLHNTMLEGLGWGKTWQDDIYDDEAPTKYTLRKNEVNRHLWTWDVFAGFRFNKVSIYYMRTMILNKEFKKMILNAETPDSAGKPYGWGRIGFNFLL
ncbi:hypothetical protein DR864_03870 [Runella rosea]|uniref:Uncharacterized protein n=1 Tax=Runella rosea TaxID=2259595 RepID=A0A344TE58_9BACT|nr:lipid A-modifier LpxR family protein [Runella rosea]AXE16929.1 hypothetical protein DR864_03870 [Runella rosea]